jgi:hypothetical protein
MWEQLRETLYQSFSRVLNDVASVLPGLLALLLAVILAVPLAWIVSRLVLRFFRGLKLDEWLDRWGMTVVPEWSPSRSPALLAGRLAYWAVMLLGIMVGLTAFNAELTSRLVQEVVEYLPNLFVAILVLIAGSVTARFVAQGALVSAVNMGLQSARLISLGVKWTVLVLTAAIALEHLGIGAATVRLAFGILLGGIVLALALAVGLGSRDVVRRSWEERQGRREVEEHEKPFQHL